MSAFFLKAVFGAFVVIFFSTALADPEPMVSIGDNGKLTYKTDEKWNRLPDFSNAGYMGGGVAIPSFPVVKTLTPNQGRGDDTERIQAAIDQVAERMPNPEGARGAVLLKRGLYRVAGSLKIPVSGVVLRGEGQGEDGTILFATGKKKRTLVVVSGKLRIKELPGTRRRINHSYVPWGVRNFSLNLASGYSVGDSVMIFRPSTKRWISDIGMDKIKRRKGTKQWREGDYDLNFERVVTEVNEPRIGVDAPTVSAMDQDYGGGYLYKFTESGRVEQSGVEELRMVSDYERGQEGKYEQHAWTAVVVDHAKDCWVRNVTTVHFNHGIWIKGQAKFVTVQDCAYLKPVSKIVGGRRYPFYINGQLSLIQRCYSENARHAQSTGPKTKGPNVFLDCLAEKTHSDTGPHHRWAVGILWDNLKGGVFSAEDRGNWGSGHGWAGAMQVFWNCEASSFRVQQPPTSQNFVIGGKGKISQGRLKDRKNGYVEALGTFVKPRSLYLKQLEDRLGVDAVKNVTTEAQRAGTIYQDLKKFR